VQITISAWFGGFLFATFAAFSNTFTLGIIFHFERSRKLGKLEKLDILSISFFLLIPIFLLLGELKFTFYFLKI